MTTPAPACPITLLSPGGGSPAVAAQPPGCSPGSAALSTPSPPSQIHVRPRLRRRVHCSLAAVRLTRAATSIRAPPRLQLLLNYCDFFERNCSLHRGRSSRTNAAFSSSEHLYTVGDLGFKPAQSDQTNQQSQRRHGCNSGNGGRRWRHFQPKRRTADKPQRLRNRRRRRWWRPGGRYWWGRRTCRYPRWRGDIGEARQDHTRGQDCRGGHSWGAAADGDQRAQLSAASVAGRGRMGGGHR